MADFTESVFFQQNRNEAHLFDDLVCFSHLRWDFIYQRPHHLLSRCAREHRVFFIEEPVFERGTAYLDIATPGPQLWKITPHITDNLPSRDYYALHRQLIDRLFDRYHIDRYILWYYNPMTFTFSAHLNPLAIVYDCMDDLFSFKGAPAMMGHCETRLLNAASVVFTGGQSLYEARRHRHQRVYAFPSSVDVAHFAQARTAIKEPPDQAGIPHPRIGFYGAIDERVDFDLVSSIADARPDWHLVLVGPIVKIDPETLPQQENIHYLGIKPYEDLPFYLAGWDTALLPFARNNATRFISPTKTLEYLAGGKPVISTSIRDVVSPYGEMKLVSIADTPGDFITTIQNVLDGSTHINQEKIDTLLAQTSWEATWKSMQHLIEDTIAQCVRN